jgi:SH3-like domain-containing protein|tara:strand:+ start:95 stop:568 length:474 start_codon:yes stop_codon:yes gene_type:complete
MSTKRYSNTFFLAILLLFAFIQPVFSAEFIAVKTKKSILYEGPSESTSKEFIVTQSYPLQVLVKLKDWIKVRDHEGKISWIKAKDITRDRTVLTLKNNVILFYKPSYSSVKLADISVNVALRLVSPLNTDGWIEVKTLSQNIEGFIRVQDVWGFSDR